jgi:hypothetical protein
VSDHRLPAATPRSTLSFVAALLIVGVLAAPAAASPTPVIVQGWTIVMNAGARGFGGTLQNDCTVLPALALSPGTATKPFAKTTFLAGKVDHVSGSYDAESGVGATMSRGPAFAFAGDWFGPTGAHHQPGVTVQDLGLQFVNGGAFVTGVLRSSRILSARTAPRRRLAFIAHPKLTSGPAFLQGAKVPESLLFAITGDATVRSALANAINRVRCPRGRAYPHSRRVRAGTLLGKIQVTMVPGAAIGTAGTVALFPDVLERCGDDCATVSIAPTGGASVGKEGSISFPLAAGTSVPLVCDQGAKCVSRAGSVSLVGGFSLGLGGAVSNATDLTFAYAGFREPSATDESAVVDGLLDGEPAVLSSFTVAATAAQTLPPATLAHLNAVLGGPLRGDIGIANTPTFTSIRLP